MVSKALEPTWITLISLIILIGRWSPANGLDIRPLLIVPAILLAIFLFTAEAEEGGKVGGITKSKYQLIFLILMIPYFIYTLAQHVLTDNKELSLEKLMSVMYIFTTVALVSLCFKQLMSFRLIDTMRWILSALCVAGFLGIVIYGGRSSIIGGGPNIFGKLMVILFIMSAPLKLSPYNALLISTSLLLVILSGSRGSYIALISSIILLFITSYIKERLKYFLILTVISILVYGFSGTTPFISRAIDTFKYRFLDLTLQQGYTSGRDWIYQAAYDYWLESPIFGNGLNFLQSREGVGYYAHNFFLEALSDHGIIGTLLLILPLIYFTVIIFLKSSELNKISKILAICALASLVAAQFSGDIYDSRLIFIFCALSLTSMNPRAVSINQSYSSTGGRL